MESEQDVLKTYLLEIRQTPLLTAAEERGLALRIREGDEVAYQDLIRANLRFVVNIVKRYRRSGISLMDLIDEGNVGLCRAARKYNPDLGLRFTSYAIWWIRNSLAIYLAKHGGVFAIPVKKVSLLYQIEKLHTNLYARHQRSPSPDELARELEISVQEVNDLSAAKKSYISLENFLNVEDGSRVSSLLSSSALSPVEKHFSLLAFREHVERKLVKLKDRERRAIWIYFGMDGSEPTQTFSELGKDLGVSREGARLLFHRAISKLKKIFREEGSLWEM